MESLLRLQTVLHNIKKITEASINKHPNIFWREVKRAKAKIVCSHAVNSINGHSIPKNIAKDMNAEIFHADFTTENDLSIVAL